MKSESLIQKEYRLELSAAGLLVWRNNSGVAKREDGTPVRYGLANESRQMNTNVKSSDLIGVKSVVVTPEMVGKTVGIFFAREVKKEGWNYTGTLVEQAQYRYIKLVNDAGGDAAFYNGSQDYA